MAVAPEMSKVAHHRACVSVDFSSKRACRLTLVTDVLVVGDANPDLILTGDVVPRFGQAEQLLSAADLVIGGSGGIFAHGLARLGRSTRLVATTGADALGDLMERLLSTGGVDTSAAGPRPRPLDRHHRGAVRAATTGRSSPTRVRSRSCPSTRPGRRSTRRCATGPGTCTWRRTSCCSELAPHLPELLAEARAQGLTTSLDTNFDPAEQWAGVTDVLPHLDVLLPNRAEALALAGSAGGGPTDRPGGCGPGAGRLRPRGRRQGRCRRCPARGPVGRGPAPSRRTRGRARRRHGRRRHLRRRLPRRVPRRGSIRRSACAAPAWPAPSRPRQLGGTAGQPTLDQLSPTSGRDADVLRQH